LNPVEKATIKDIEQMHHLINSFAERGEMIARPLSEMYENTRDYFVARDGERVVGCVALHVNWLDLAEIKSLAVAEDSRGKRIGGQLVEACLKEAEALGIPTVFCLTYRADFFKRLGFSLVNKDELPRKVWVECYRCPKFPNCDEVALVHNLKVGA